LRSTSSLSNPTEANPNEQSNEVDQANSGIAVLDEQPGAEAPEANQGNEQLMRLAKLLTQALQSTSILTTHR
jgi:hypothetical protein